MTNDQDFQKKLADIVYGLYEDAWSHGNREVTGRNKRTTKRALTDITKLVASLLEAQRSPEPKRPKASPKRDR